MNLTEEQFSAFNEHNLGILERFESTNPIICGLATEYCILKTFETAVQCGFIPIIHKSAIRSFIPGGKDEEYAINRFKRDGLFFD